MHIARISTHDNSRGKDPAKKPPGTYLVGSPTRRCLIAQAPPGIQQSCRKHFYISRDNGARQTDKTTSRSCYLTTQGWPDIIITLRNRSLSPVRNTRSDNSGAWRNGLHAPPGQSMNGAQEKMDQTPPEENQQLAPDCPSRTESRFASASRAFCVIVEVWKRKEKHAGDSVVVLLTRHPQSMMVVGRPAASDQLCEHAAEPASRIVLLSLDRGPLASVHPTFIQVRGVSHGEAPVAGKSTAASASETSSTYLASRLHMRKNHCRQRHAVASFPQAYNYTLSQQPLD